MLNQLFQAFEKESVSSEVYHRRLKLLPELQVQHERLSKQESTTQKWAKLASYIGITLSASGRFEESEAILLNALKKVDDLNDFTMERLQISNYLAYTYIQLGKYQEAVLLLESRLPNFQSNTLDVVMAYNRLGLAFLHLTQHEKAMDFFKKAQAHCLPLGEDTPMAARVLCFMGQAYLAQNDLKNAEHCLLNALQLKEKCYDNTHPSLALTLKPLSELYHLLGDKDRAITYLNQAYELELSVYGESHPYTQETKQKLNKQRG